MAEACWLRSPAHGWLPARRAAGGGVEVEPGLDARRHAPLDAAAGRPAADDVAPRLDFAAPAALADMTGLGEVSEAAIAAELSSLIRLLSSVSSQFIRCIKPNMIKAADTFDGGVVLRQLRYTGMLECIHILRVG